MPVGTSVAKDGRVRKRFFEPKKPLGSPPPPRFAFFFRQQLRLCATRIPNFLIVLLALLGQDKRACLCKTRMESLFPSLTAAFPLSLSPSLPTSLSPFPFSPLSFSPLCEYMEPTHKDSSWPFFPIFSFAKLKQAFTQIFALFLNSFKL